MGFTEFCCRNGGSNLNAGTRTGNSTEPGTSADFTYASGNWVASTGKFTVASGNPQSDGIAVGDFASVYADGSTVTGFVGRVTARDATSVTVSLTAKAGTAPTDGTGNRTLKIGGAWSGPTGSTGWPITTDFSACTNASGDLPRINLKSDVTASITASMTAAGNRVAFQGYSSSYGDGLGRAVIDGGTSGASYVLLSVASNLTQWYEDIEFRNNGATGSANGVAVSGNRCVFRRCVFHDVRGVGLSGSIFTNCFAVECEAYNCNKSNTSDFAGFSLLTAIRCISHDNSGANNSGFAACFATGCISESNGRDGFIWYSNNSVSWLSNCTCYNNGRDGIRVSGGGVNIYIENCVVTSNAGYGINNAGSSNIVMTQNCAFRSNTSGATNGVTAAGQELGSVTLTGDPFADAANGDFDLNSTAGAGSSCRDAGRGTFTQTAASYSGTVGYPDIGAAQHQDAGGGGGLLTNPGLRGGFL